MLYLISVLINKPTFSPLLAASVNFTPVPYGKSNQAQGIVFPWILGVFDLEAFQFFKVIESFIRGAPTITMQIINVNTLLSFLTCRLIFLYRFDAWEGFIYMSLCPMYTQVYYDCVLFEMLYVLYPLSKFF